MVCLHYLENISYYGHYKFANDYIPLTFITFLLTEVVCSTNYILESSSFIRSYSMSISSKGICLVISGFVKERSKSPCGKSLLWVQNLQIEFFFIDTITLFVLNIDQHKNIIYIFQEIYILLFKKNHQMLLDFHMVPHIIGVYMGQM